VATNTATVTITTDRKSDHDNPRPPSAAVHERAATALKATTAARTAAAATPAGEPEGR
jgi:hypothetical protein